MKLSAITLAFLAPLALAAASPAAEAEAEADGSYHQLCPNLKEPPKGAWCYKACYSINKPCFKCPGKTVSYLAKKSLT
jgi:hypothetical protein